MLARFCFVHNKPEEGKLLLERAVAVLPDDPEANLQATQRLDSKSLPVRLLQEILHRFRDEPESSRRRRMFFLDGRIHYFRGGVQYVCHRE